MGPQSFVRIEWFVEPTGSTKTHAFWDARRAVPRFARDARIALRRDGHNPTLIIIVTSVIFWNRVVRRTHWFDHEALLRGTPVGRSLAVRGMAGLR